MIQVNLARLATLYEGERLVESCTKPGALECPAAPIERSCARCKPGTAWKDDEGDAQWFPERWLTQLGFGNTGKRVRVERQRSGQKSEHRLVPLMEFPMLD